MDISSLPGVTRTQIKEMERLAQQRMEQEGQSVYAPHPALADPMVASAAKQQQEPIQESIDTQEYESPALPENNYTAPEESIVEEKPREVKDTKNHRKTPAESFSELKAKADRHAREAERIAKERDEYAQRLYEYERSLKQQQPQQNAEPELNINADDLLEGKHLKPVYKELQELKQQLYKSQQEAILASTEARIKSQYGDFDKVVSSENLELLKYTYPELANTINSSNDLYNKAVSAYLMIKQTGIYKEQTFDAEKKRIHDNSLKPRLAPAGNATEGDTPLSKANLFSGGLTDDLKKQLAKEMFEARQKV